MTNSTCQASRRCAIFQKTMAAHGIDRCVIVTGSFRAGTSFVCSLLAANGMPGISDERFGKLTTIFRNPDEDFQNQLDQIFMSATDGLFVTKIMWPHRNALAQHMGFDRAESVKLAAMFPRARWINIVRRDKVGQAISFWKAKATNQWQQVKSDQPAPDPDYDFDRIRACYVELSAHDMLWQDFHALAGTEVHHILYEDFVEQVATDLPPLLSWLDDHRLPSGPIKTTSALKKQRNAHSEAMRERFLEDLYRTGF
ncbi:Stf0 family sulfotransferase [Gemmobacter nectariphilus]|uniref:Stf0 family sulfotransferase n=1 Tax=Gemmobacter nectariphilus TaxID=220343 RepID=UPI0003F73788|nr:Stf0 family sulfotransferase [Gemmobacter nectariphilus]